MIVLNNYNFRELVTKLRSMTETIKMLSSENIALRTENESLISVRPVNGKMLIQKHWFKGIDHLFGYVQKSGTKMWHLCIDNIVKIFFFKTVEWIFYFFKSYWINVDSAVAKQTKVCVCAERKCEFVPNSWTINWLFLRPQLSKNT